MKRTFADLHLQIDLGNMTMVERIIGKIAQLGFRLVGVPLPPEANISLVNRVDLRPKSRGQLMNQLRKLRRKFEVICVLCENKEVARQAAKDRRVDLLNFPALGYTRRFFDWAEAELASKTAGARNRCEAYVCFGRCCQSSIALLFAS